LTILQVKYDKELGNSIINFFNWRLNVDISS